MKIKIIVLLIASALICSSIVCFTSLKTSTPLCFKPYELMYSHSQHVNTGEFMTLYCNNGSTDETVVIFHKGKRVKEISVGCFHYDITFDIMTTSMNILYQNMIQAYYSKKT